MLHWFTWIRRGDEICINPIWPQLIYIQSTELIYTELTTHLLFIISNTAKALLSGVIYHIMYNILHHNIVLWNKVGFMMCSESNASY